MVFICKLGDPIVEKSGVRSGVHQGSRPGNGNEGRIVERRYVEACLGESDSVRASTFSTTSLAAHANSLDSMGLDDLVEACEVEGGRR
jgi:hypothetical protein